MKLFFPLQYLLLLKISHFWVIKKTQKIKIKIRTGVVIVAWVAERKIGGGIFLLLFILTWEGARMLVG